MARFQERWKYLGASELAAAIGWSPWTDPADVWRAKVERVEEEVDNLAVRIGQHMESFMLALASEKLGGEVVADQVDRPIPGTPIICHCDGLLDGKVPVEIKVTGVANPAPAIWSSGIPLPYYVQAMAQAVALGSDITWVVALIGGRGIRVESVEFAPEIWEIILERALTFWNCVEEKKPLPEGWWTPPPKNPGQKPKELSDDLAELVLRYAELKQAEKELQDIRAAIVERLPVGEKFRAGGVVVMRSARTSKHINTKQLEKDYPDLVAKYREERTYDMLTVKVLEDST